MPLNSNEILADINRLHELEREMDDFDAKQMRLESKQKIIALIGMLSGAGLFALSIAGADGLLDTQGIPMGWLAIGVMAGLVILGASIADFPKNNSPVE